MESFFRAKLGEDKEPGEDAVIEGRDRHESPESWLVWLFCLSGSPSS